MNMSYRKVEFTPEIIFLLNNYVQNKWPLLLWQSFSRHDPREATILEVNTQKKSIVVSPTNNTSILDPNAVLYCHGKEKMMVFKTLNMGLERGVLSVGLPNDIRLQELRANQRYEMYSNKKAFISVTVSSHYESKESSYVLRLNDISTTGASIRTHSSNTKHFSIGMNIKVTQIGSDFIHGGMSATVLDIRPVEAKAPTEVQLYRIGLKFERPIEFYMYYLTKTLQQF
jgi:hypothetical protein